MFTKFSSKRNNFTAFLLMTLGVGALAGCGPQGSGDTASPAPLKKVTIALGYIPDVQFAPFYVALNKGYYRDEGLDVQFKHGIVPDLIKDLGLGTDDVNFAVASGDEIIPARVQGVPAVYVMTWYRQYPVAAASLPSRGTTLKSPADLKGKTVGVPGPYGATYTGLQALLKSAGLSLSDIKLKSIGFTQAQSLSTGQVDVAMVYAANEPVQLASKGLEVTTLLVSDSSKLASNGLATNDKTLKGDPELVAKVVRGTLKGIDDTIKDPDGAFKEAVKFVPEAAKEENQRLQMDVLRESTGLMKAKGGDPAVKHAAGWIDPEVWAATQSFLLESKAIPNAGKLDEMYSNHFVEK